MYLCSRSKKDSLAGIKAIKSAGMIALGVGGQELMEAGADVIVDTTDQITINLLKQLMKD